MMPSISFSSLLLNSLIYLLKTYTDALICFYSTSNTLGSLYGAAYSELFRPFSYLGNSVTFIFTLYPSIINNSPKSLQIHTPIRYHYMNRLSLNRWFNLHPNLILLQIVKSNKRQYMFLINVYCLLSYLIRFYESSSGISYGLSVALTISAAIIITDPPYSSVSYGMHIISGICYPHTE